MSQRSNDSRQVVARHHAFSARRYPYDHRACITQVMRPKMIAGFEQ